MEKDWQARFELPKPFSRVYAMEFLRIGCALLLLAAGILWAISNLSMGLYDSMGHPRSLSLAGRITVFGISFAPLLVEVPLFIWYWRQRSKKPRQVNS